MDEEAEREASAYVQTAMSFAGFTAHAPRLTVVSPATRDFTPAQESSPSNAVAEPSPVRTAPVIPIGLPEGATLPPITEPRAIVAPLPTRAPEVFVAPAPPVERQASAPASYPPARPRSSSSSTVAIMFGLGFLVFGVALTRRRRRRSWSRS